MTDPLKDTPILGQLVQEGRRRLVEQGRRYFGGRHAAAPDGPVASPQETGDAGEPKTVGYLQGRPRFDALDAAVERMVPPRGGQPEAMPWARECAFRCGLLAQPGSRYCEACGTASPEGPEL